MIREIRVIGDPVLRKHAEPVPPPFPPTSDVLELISDLKETMYAKDGLGLAAPQIGISRRIVVIDASSYVPGEALRILINPRLTYRSTEVASYEEACLSLPGEWGEVERPAEVSLEYYDIQGHRVVLENIRRPMSVFVQHELDHLDGKLYIDYLSSLKRELITKRIKKTFRG